MYINFHRLKKRLKWLLPLVIILLVLTSNWFWRLFYPFPYQDIVMREARVNGMDPYLVAALIHAESRFSAGAESGSGARGIMQIMPETGKWAAEQMGLSGFNEGMLFDPETNIKIGCWYLADLDREFDGSRYIVLAAYNAGRGNVKQWLTRKVWDGRLETIRQVPFPETRNYVVTVTNSYRRYKDLYGKDS
ncbi:MAG: lytic transglycosylase domain-containing protein [Bacillota bacterium]